MSQRRRPVPILGTLAAIAAGTVFSGCAITQSVKPVAQAESREVCVIENPKSEMDFGPTYERLLAERGYQ